VKCLFSAVIGLLWRKICMWPNVGNRKMKQLGRLSTTSCYIAHYQYRTVTWVLWFLWYVDVCDCSFICSIRNHNVIVIILVSVLFNTFHCVFSFVMLIILQVGIMHWHLSVCIYVLWRQWRTGQSCVHSLSLFCNFMMFIAWFPA